MRLEDLGKKLFVNASPLDNELILQKFEEFFIENPTAQYFILLSKDIDYYTVFKPTISGSNAKSLLEYFTSSWFGLPNEDIKVSMKDIVNLEIREDGCLEIWIQSIYFHLSPFDWGVEQL